jgi:transcription elongation regulator 1
MAQQQALRFRGPAPPPNAVMRGPPPLMRPPPPFGMMRGPPPPPRPPFGRPPFDPNMPPMPPPGGIPPPMGPPHLQVKNYRGCHFLVSVSINFMHRFLP